MKVQPNKALILNSLAVMARGAGRPPSRREFLAHSGFSEGAFLRFFPSWSAALRAASLAPYTQNLRLDDRQLLEDWGRAVRKHRKAPGRRVYRHLGKFDHRTIERRFGRWSQIPVAFRKFAKSKREWADVVALLPPCEPKPSLQRLQNGHRAQDCQLRSSVSVGTIRHRPLPSRPTYGQPIDFRGLRHEPVNEQGVVLLFGMVAKELGYIVESVQAGFPDCEAKRQIAPQRWQRVHLEFEFESRNYRDHGHPLTGCDVIVCWRHNWPHHPPHLEILELSSLLPTIPASS